MHRAYLGVIIQPLTQALAKQFRPRSTPACWSPRSAGSPAAKAGMKPGDIIVSSPASRSPVRTSCKAMVEEARIGSSQSLTVLRDGKRMSMSVTCREMPADFTTANMQSPAGQGGAFGLPL